jgi:L-lysine 2,3-aminomutase
MRRTAPAADAGIAPLLDRRGYRPESIRTVLDEHLLPRTLVDRLHALFPRASGLHPTAPPMFTDRERYGGVPGYRDVCAVLARHGIDIGHHDERELFIDVYRFLVTRHTLNSIDWSNFADDSMFQLVFPQPGMIPGEVVDAYRRASTREERQAVAERHMRDTNPHDGNQLLNKPTLAGPTGDMEIVDGCQHKYPQIALVFDRTTQSCFSFCTYCFRHAQVRGDEDMFLQEDAAQIHAYLREHTEVDDLLITGGDAGQMPAERFREYVEPLMDDPRLIHVKTVRLGSRALTYDPETVLHPDFDAMLATFDRLYDHGIQVAWMAHFSTPREVLNPATLAAIRRLQAHRVVIRSQSPIMKHISLFVGDDGRVDIERSARNWIDLGNVFGMLGLGFHSIYCARPTGEHAYFTAPLAEVSKVFNRVYRALPSLQRPSRHLSMTTSAGKISILGTAEVHGETVFALQFTEGRDMEWLDPVFLARYDEKTNNVALLEPFGTDRFFFEDELREIEARLAETLAARTRA